MYSCVNKCENQTKKIARNKHVIWLICERFLREKKTKKKTENALFWTEEQFGRASKKMNAKKPKKTTRNTES